MAPSVSIQDGIPASVHTDARKDDAGEFLICLDNTFPRVVSCSPLPPSIISTLYSTVTLHIPLPQAVDDWGGKRHTDMTK